MTRVFTFLGLKPQLLILLLARLPGPHGASGTVAQPLPDVLGSQGLWLLVLFPSGLPTLSLFNAGVSQSLASP